MRRLLLVAFLAFCLPAHALYYAACGAGAHASCVPGDDSNDGLSAAAPKLTLPTASLINSMGCGGQHLLAKGSAWENYSAGVIDTGANCTSNPVVVGDYDPPSGATGRPRLCNTTTDGVVFVLGSYNNTTDDRGYLFRGLELCGDATHVEDGFNASRGFHIFGRTSYVTLDDVYIHGFRIGMEISPELGGSAMTIDHITVKNATISDNYSMGILGSADDMLIVDTLFEGNNYSGSDRNHAVYLSPSEYFANRITIRRVTVRDNSIPDSWSTNYAGPGICTGGGITMHGLLNGITIEDSTIEVTTGAIVACYGYSVTEGYPGVANEVFNNIILRRNKTIGLATSIAHESAPGLIIENNVAVATTTTVPNCYIYAGLNNEAQASPRIYNNTIYAYQGPAICTDTAGSPANQLVANNLVAFSSGSGTRSCAAHRAKSAYDFYDNNLCYGSSRYSSTYTTGAQAADCPSGTASFDCNGLTNDPLFVEAPTLANGGNVQLQGGSPAVGAGNDTYCARLTKDGKVRTGTCTIGAYQPGL